MIKIDSEWKTLKGTKTEFKLGRWCQWDFGPECDLKIVKRGDEIHVKPKGFRCDPENSIGDFNFIKLMCDELFDEFGCFSFYIPRYNAEVKIADSNTEEALIGFLRDLPLLG